MGFAARDRVRFGILCVLAYVAVSWAGRFDMRLGDQIASLSYPFDTFSMYGRMPGEDRSHLLIRDARGGIHRVTAFRSFECDEPITGPSAHCARKRGILYHFEELTRYIQEHPGAGGMEVDLITRTWQIRAGEATVPTSDCVIAHCRVSRQ